jgi:hypothetical protein
MTRPAFSRLLAALALGLGLVVSQTAGADGAAHRIVKKGVEGGVEGTLESLNDPYNKKLLKQLLQDPEIKKAAHDLTAAITGGALDGMTEEARMKRVRDISDAYIRTVSASVGKALKEDISPAVTKTVEDVVSRAVSAALRPENKRLARNFVDGVTRSTITAFTQSTAQGLRDDLGPALNKVIAEDLGPAVKKVIEQDLGPAMGKMIRDDLQPAMANALGGESGTMIGALVREITKEAVLGANDGMTELGISLDRNDKPAGIGIFGWMAIVLGLVVAILGILLTRTILTRRSLEQERARSERMLLNVLRTIQYTDTDDPTRPPDLDALLARARMQDNDFDPNHETWVAGLLARARVPSKASRVAGSGGKATAIPPRRA